MQQVQVANAGFKSDIQNRNGLAAGMDPASAPTSEIATPAVRIEDQGRCHVVGMRPVEDRGRCQAVGYSGKI